MNVETGTHRSLQESIRKLCTTKFFYNNWGEFWESIYVKEKEYTWDGTLTVLKKYNGNKIGYYLTIDHCPGDGYESGVTNHDPGHAFYDAAALLKYSITKNSAPVNDFTNYTATVYAIVHPEAVRCTAPDGETYDRVRILQELGYETKILGNPIFPYKDLGLDMSQKLKTDAGQRTLMPLHLMDEPGHPIGGKLFFGYSNIASPCSTSTNPPFHSRNRF